MCLSIPAKVIEIDGETATVSVGNVIYRASLQLVENVSVGDYILLHTGFAIQKISTEEATETLRVFKDFEALNNKIDEEENYQV